MSNEYDDIIAAEPGPKANEYDALLATQGDEKRQALRSSIISTGDTNPDEAAKALQLSKRTGVPAPVVERNMPVVEKSAQLNEYDQLLNTAPVTASALSDPAFARIAKDDTANMVGIEHTANPPPGKPMVNPVEYSQMVQKAMKDNAIDADTARTLVSSHVQVDVSQPAATPGTNSYIGASTASGLYSLAGTVAKLADALNPFTLNEQDAATLFKNDRAKLAQMELESPAMLLTRFARGMQDASSLAIQNLSPEAKQAYGGLKYATLDPSKAAYLSPVKLAGDAIQSLPTSLAMGASIYLTKGVGLRVEQQALAQGIAPEIARKMMIAASSETMAVLGASSEGAAGYGQQYMQTRQAADEVPQAMLEKSPMYQELIKHGFNPDAARAWLSSNAAELAGLEGGTVDVVTNFFGGKILGKIIGEGGSVVKRTLKGAATEAPVEAVQSGGEQLSQNEAVQRYLNPMQDILDGVAENIAMGFFVGGATGGAFSGFVGGHHSAATAEINAGRMERLFKLTQASKVMERDPSSAANFVQAAAEQGQMGDIHVDARTFAQEVGDKLSEIVQASPAVATQLEAAMKSGGDLVIPTGEYTTKIAPLYDNVDHLRIGPDEFSRDEAKTFMQDQVAQFDKEQQARLEEGQFDTAFRESAASVENELLTQLNAAGRFTTDVNAVMAKTAAAYYTVQAAKLGMTPEQFYVRNPLHTQVSPLVGGKMHGQENQRENTTQQGAEGDLDFTRSLTEPAQLHTTVGGGHAEQGWAGATGIRRTNGQPATVYRGAGTRLAPEHFHVESLGAASGNPSSGLGVWFTNDRTEAVTYGEPEAFQLDIRNPLTVPVEELPGFDSVEAAHAWREEIRAAGHDGLIISAAHLGGRTHIVAFDPHQVVYPNERTFNQETIENNTGALDEQPPFFSVLFRQLENSKINTAPAAQWKAIINGLSSKGVKKEEVEMSGILNWLDLRAEQAVPREHWQLLASDNEIVAQGDAESGANWQRLYDAGALPEGESVVKVTVAALPNNVTKDQVLEYIRANGTEVETKILGEPPKPKKTTEVAVVEPTSEEPTDLPDDYTVEVNDDGDEFTALDPDNEEIGTHDTFAGAREEAYVHEARAAADEEHYPSEDRIQEKAEELWRERDTDYYYEWARESDWVKFNDPHIVVPNARIVEERNHGLFGWRIELIEYPNKDDVQDVRDLDEPEYSSSEHNAELGLVFPTQEAAQQALVDHGVAGEPWIDETEDPHFIAEFTEHEDDTTNPHSTYQAAEREAKRRQEQFIENEAQSSIENDSFGDDGDTEFYTDRAREELEATHEQEREDAEHRARRFARGQSLESRPEREPPDPNRVRHGGSWQSDGGRKYREIVLSVPGIEPYNAGDSTHFATDTGGRTVVWGRFKIHLDAAGVATMFIEEDQSQRGQHGKEMGFADPAEKAKRQAEFNALNEQHTQLSEQHDNLVVSNTAANPNTEQIEALRQQLTAIQERMRELQAMPPGTVPPAPFVKDTKSWAALGLKRMLRWAVDNGITQVAWTTGAENAVRYGTRSEIDALKWEKVEGGVKIEGVKDGKVVLIKQLENEAYLRAYVGRASQTIYNDPAQSGELPADKLDAINGLGMQAFYGDVNGAGPKGDPAIMTIVANKIIKDLGDNQKVGRMPVTVTEKGQTFAGNPGFKITPEMAAKIKGGFALFQENRGQITFADTLGQGSTISLLEHADLSTFFHELGHFMFEVQVDIATQPDAPQGIKDDVNKLLKWFGVPGLDVWRAMSLEEQRPYHEQFARGFEAYLFEGKAPSLELSDTFARIRAWMINVYRALTGMKVQLTDEVRGVMDRLIASNEQIMAAEQARNFAPMYKSAEEMGATPAEWKAYQELAYATTQSAVSELDARSLRDMQWLNNAHTGELGRLQKDAKAKRDAVEAEVTAEVRAKPEYAVQRFLRYGELPEANRSREQRRIAEEAALQGTKINLGDLKEMYGEGPAAPWRYLPTGPHGMVTAKDGMHPELVSQLFGFKSADEMIRTILGAQPEANVIEGMTDQRTLERYGDLTDPTRMKAAANKAVHNELRARVLATELRALDKAANPRQDTGRVNTKGSKISIAVLPRAAKEFAHTIIARLKIRDVKPARFEAAEARNARAAAAKTDLVERATEKRNQLVNNYATKEAYAALDEIDAGIAYFKRFDNKGTIKALSRDYLEQIYGILERYDLRALPLNTADKRKSLLEWVKDQEEQGFAPTIDKEILNEARRMPYKEMTVEEFRGMRDAIKNIEHLARLKQKLLTSKDKREFRAAADGLAASIIDNAPKTLPPRRSSDHGLGVSVKSLFNTFTAIHRKFASFAREMDGWKDGGAAWELLVRNMNEKGTFETVENTKATRALMPMLEPVLKQWGRRLTMRQDFNGKSYSPEERISLLLNMGNDTNMERVTTGENLSPQALQHIVSQLTPADIKFVNQVWAYLDTFKDQIGAKEIRVNGVAPEWVEARPFQLKLITGEVVDLRGGYYPIAYDPLLNEKAAAGNEADVYKQMSQGRYARAQTRRGHIESRVESTGRPLRFDFAQVLANHISQVVHDLAWHEYMIDANRLMRDPAIENAMRNHYGVEVIKEMKDTLRDITIGPLNVDKGSQFLNYMRYGTTISGLALNVFNSLQNMTGITQSFARVGSKWMVKGIAHWAGDTITLQNSMKKVYEMSPMMAERARTGGNRELSELKGKVGGEFDDSKLMAVYWYLNNKTQQIVDIPTWWGAYEKAMAEDKMDEGKAIALADQAVLDAQGGGQLKDLSGIQRGSAGLKLLTTFYGFFNTTYNLTAESYGRTDFKKPGDVLLFGADMLLLYSIPALLSSLLKGWLQDDLEKRRLLKRIASDQLNYMLGTMVGLREVNAGAQAAAGLSTMGYTGPAGTRIFNDLYLLGVQIHQGRLDENFWKALNNTAGILLHYPAGQLNRIGEALAQYHDGKTSNPGILIAGPKPKK